MPPSRDFGVNRSTRVNDKLRVGGQLYDRNLGQLGQYHPSLDFAVADYRFKSWLGIRGGKGKTTIGLYNDTQDQDFLHTFALLPRSVYPTDIRDATIAHLGGDIYGNISLRHRLGDLAYTVYAGHRSDSIIAVIPIFYPSMGSTSKARVLACAPRQHAARYSDPIPMEHRGLPIGQESQVTPS